MELVLAEDCDLWRGVCGSLRGVDHLSKFEEVLKVLSFQGLACMIFAAIHFICTRFPTVNVFYWEMHSYLNTPCYPSCVLCLRSLIHILR